MEDDPVSKEQGMPLAPCAMHVEEKNLLQPSNINNCLTSIQQSQMQQELAAPCIIHFVTSKLKASQKFARGPRIFF